MSLEAARGPRTGANLVAPLGPYSTALRWFAAVTTVLLFVVVVLGFLDTATNSALGCGRSFPLCHGRFLPEANLPSVIEWTHRVASAFVGLVVLALAVWAWIVGRGSRRIRGLAVLGLGFLLIEATVGAAAVLTAESKWVIAIHLGIALTSFAAIASLTALVWGMGHVDERAVAESGVGRLLWLCVGLLYVILYWGALVAQTRSGPACGGWPLCQGGVVPSHWTGPVAIDYVHRLFALSAGVVFFALVRRMRPLKERSRTLYRMGHVALGLVVLLMASGAYLVLSGIALVATLVHVSLASLLFATVVYMAVCTLPERATAALPVTGS